MNNKAGEVTVAREGKVSPKNAISERTRNWAFDNATTPYELNQAIKDRSAHLLTELENTRNISGDEYARRENRIYRAGDNIRRRLGI